MSRAFRPQQKQQQKQQRKEGKNKKQTLTTVDLLIENGLGGDQ
jgi:hypothetical protein